MSSRHPFSMKRTPWFPARVSVRKALGRDAFGRPTTLSVPVEYAAKLVNEPGGELIDGTMRAERVGVTLAIATSDIVTGDLLTFRGVEYTVTYVIATQDHGGETHVQEVLAYVKRGEGEI